MANTADNRPYATGRRKTATARVWLTPGEGKITVNKTTAKDYFKRETLDAMIAKPLALAGLTGKMDVYSTVVGGGLAGQAGALRHGIARAIEQYDAGLRAPLKKAGFITRDPREKERKKPGRKRARKRFQFSKR
ncbi:MAG: 30S ribosomal protein S9 [Nitrospinae bacterium]|nr:30S ribosomal protein S9 [Nitrospinota bacterium]